ncbi:MAG: hypothetical protein AAGI68_04075 [Planctomycetota bacterium]
MSGLADEAGRSGPEPLASGPVYVLGSGESLLGLTAGQKAELARHPRVAMNKYLLFWEKVGVWPSHLFLADAHYPAVRVYQESHRVIASGVAEGRSGVHFLLDRLYARKYGAGRWRGRAGWANLKTFGRGLLSQRFVYRPWYRPEPVTFFAHEIASQSSPGWARSLEEPLYFYRGSLTVLINLLCLLFPGRELCLLGVDLTGPSFFDAELTARPELHDRYVRLEREQPGEGLHATQRVIEGLPGVMSRLPEVVEHAAGMGVRVTCGSRSSLLVSEGVCEYVSVPEADADAEAERELMV